ncbi:MAG: helix-turn-helix domain-containing protein, partial [Candidatus Brocadiae bacterium]|nr:helix-turn-helix domain-containing protein [Candidatus Brocadiia bacterium]
WPGNVRELRNAVEHGVILARETTIELDSLPRSIVQAWAAPRGLRRGLELLPLKEALREPERQYILQTLRAVRWNKQHAAKELRISRSTLYKKIKEYGLEPEPAVDDPLMSGAFGTLGRQGATSA